MDKTIVTKTFTWSPPISNWVKLNSDGTCKNNLVDGYGGVIKDENGKWLGGFSKYLGPCNAFMDEMWGLFEGDKLA